MEEEDLTMMTMDKMMPGMEVLAVDQIRVAQRGEEGRALSLLRAPVNPSQRLRVRPNLLQLLRVQTDFLKR